MEHESHLQRFIRTQVDALVDAMEKEALEALVVLLMERQNRLAIRNLELGRDLDEALYAYGECWKYITESRHPFE